MPREDVAAYLRRLGVEAEPPSVDGLRRLHRAHVERVPYETFWIHLDQAWGIEPEASLRRVARDGRGGYCFQLNGSLSLLLEALGYRVTRHVGGVHGPEGPSVDALTNHLVLVVHDLADADSPDGRWYVDAGLGDALHEPLPRCRAPSSRAHCASSCGRRTTASATGTSRTIPRAPSLA